MELLLNLAWLLLALPACWLWWSRRSTPAGRKFTALQCLLALGCVLVILFPVVSATDDLRAMRTEMEETPVSKRSVRLASTDKVPCWKWQGATALTTSAAWFVADNIVWLQALAPLTSPEPAPTSEPAARAPPASLLG